MAPEVAKKPLKGILKKPKAQAQSTPASTAPPAGPAPDNSIVTTTTSKPDARAVAIHHARLLEERKAVEAAIFDNILTLLDYPLHPTQPPASAPHPSDVDGFAALVRIFQPSDYDDLIIERNLSGDRCGYVLCPARRRRFRGAGTYKMVNKGRRDFDIVETRELEKWCSAACTRRALWVKVQLNETAAWERAGLPELKIELYPEKEKENEKKEDENGAASEDKQEEAEPASAEQQRQPSPSKEGPQKEGRDSQQLAADLAKVQLEQDRKAAGDTAALALERGDDTKDVFTRPVDIVIREKTVTTQAEAPSLDDEVAQGGSIEGYKAKFGGESGHESDEDSDWGI